MLARLERLRAGLERLLAGMERLRARLERLQAGGLRAAEGVGEEREPDEGDGMAKARLSGANGAGVIHAARLARWRG